MGSLRLALCAGAVVAAALTPAAYASDTAGTSGAGVSVTPASPAPGSDIRLVARGCAGRTATAASGAFVAAARLTGAARADGTLVGETRVRTSLPPGTYDIKVGCDGHDGRATGTITVPQPTSSTAAPSSTATSSAAATSSTAATPSAPVSPIAPVRAGGGGTAHLAAVNAAHAVDARNAGPGTRQAVIGLVLASVAAIAVAMRSSRRNQDTD